MMSIVEAYNSIIEREIQMENSQKNSEDCSFHVFGFIFNSQLLVKWNGEIFSAAKIKLIY